MVKRALGEDDGALIPLVKNLSINDFRNSFFLPSAEEALADIYDQKTETIFA